MYTHRVWSEIWVNVAALYMFIVEKFFFSTIMFYDPKLKYQIFCYFACSTSFYCANQRYSSWDLIYNAFLDLDSLFLQAIFKADDLWKRDCYFCFRNRQTHFEMTD